MKDTKESRQHNYILYVFVHIKVTNKHEQSVISEVRREGTLVGNNVTWWTSSLLHLEAKGVPVDYVKIFAMSLRNELNYSFKVPLKVNTREWCRNDKKNNFKLSDIKKHVLKSKQSYPTKNISSQPRTGDAYGASAKILLEMSYENN